jgi:hypothetical protein
LETPWLGKAEIFQILLQGQPCRGKTARGSFGIFLAGGIHSPADEVWECLFLNLSSAKAAGTGRSGRHRGEGVGQEKLARGDDVGLQTDSLRYFFSGIHIQKPYNLIL